MSNKSNPIGSKEKTPKLRKRTVTRNGKKYQYFSVDLGQVNGKRIFKSFKTELEAKAFIATQKNLRKQIGKASRKLDNKTLQDAAYASTLLPDGLTLSDAVRRAIILTDEQVSDALDALKTLNQCAELSEAAEYYVKHHDPQGGKRIIAEVIEEYIEEGRQDDLRQRSIQDMQLRLQRFSNSFGDRYITEISRKECQDWLKKMKSQHGKELAPLSKRHYRTVIGGMFNYAIEHEYVVENPFTQKTRRRNRKRKGDEKMPGILSVKEIQKLLTTAQNEIPEMLPALAIGAFAGLRTTEARQLDWSNIDLADKRITVPPKIAKRRSVRHVAISGNLLAWLTPYRKEKGRIAPDDKAWRHSFDKARRLAKIKEWPTNALRHSFASNHLAMYGNQNKTALELGHRDTDLLYNHYRALVKREDAEKYWKILPSKTKVIPFEATA